MRVMRERVRGRSLRTIAAARNDDGVPQHSGGKAWYASTVAGVLRSHELDAPILQR